MMSESQNTKMVTGLDIQQVHIPEIGNILMPLPFVAMLLENVLYPFFSCQHPGLPDTINDVPKQPGSAAQLLFIKIPDRKGASKSGENSTLKPCCTGLSGLRKVGKGKNYTKSQKNG